MNPNSIIWRGSYGNWRKYVFSSSLPEGFRRLFSLAQYKLLRIYLTGSPTQKLEKKIFLKLETWKKKFSLPDKGPTLGEF